MVVTNVFIVTNEAHHFEIYRYSARFTRNTVRDILILFWNICYDIVFNRAIPINNIVLYANPEKTIIDLARATEWKIST